MHAGRGGKVAFGGDGEHTGFDFLPLKNVNMNYRSTNWKYCLGAFPVSEISVESNSPA